MPCPVRYTNGVTTVPATNPFGQLIIPDPTSVHMFMDDFDYFDPMRWIVHRTETLAATGTSNVTSREQMADARNGILTVVTTVNDNDSVFFQRGQLETYDDGDNTSSTTTYGESFALASTKKVWFKARLKADDVGTLRRHGTDLTSRRDRDAFHPDGYHSDVMQFDQAGVDHRDLVKQVGLQIMGQTDPGR